MTGRWRGVLLAAYAGYLVVVLYLVFSPSGRTAGASVAEVTSALHRLGFAGVGGTGVERGLNVLLFVPFGGLGVLLVPRLRWPSWVVLGAAFSALIEVTQQRFLSERVPSWTDLATNTAGTFLGAGLVGELWLLRHRPRSTPPHVAVRAVIGVLAVVMAAAVAVTVFSPTSVGPSEVVAAAGRGLRQLGVTGVWTTPHRLERVFNVLLFVPVGLVLALLRPRWRLFLLTLCGAALSVWVELVQGVLLPGRDASMSDVAMNTLGAGCGAAVVLLLLKGLTSRHCRKPDETCPARVS